MVYHSPWFEATQKTVVGRLVVLNNELAEFIRSRILIAIEEKLTWREVAFEIVRIPAIQDLLRKAEYLDEVFWPEPRKKGWLHRDDPIEGMEVVTSKHQYDLQNSFYCSVCHAKYDDKDLPCNDIIKPLTVGEWIDMAQYARVTDHHIGSTFYRISIDLPSGERVRRD